MQPSSTTETSSASQLQMGDVFQVAAKPHYELLYDLCVEQTYVCSARARYGVTAKKGDYFDLRGDMIHLPGTQGLSVHAIAVLLPFLREKQRFDPIADDPHFLASYDTSLQPYCSCTFKVTRTRLSSIPSATAAPPPGRELVPVPTQSGVGTKEADGSAGAGSRSGPTAGPRLSTSSGTGAQTTANPVPVSGPTTLTTASVSTSTSRGPHQTGTTTTATSSPSPKGSTPKRARRVGPGSSASAKAGAKAGQGSASSATAVANTNTGPSKSKDKKKSSWGSGSNRKGKTTTSGANQRNAPPTSIVGAIPQIATTATTPASGSSNIASQNPDVWSTPALAPAAEIGGRMGTHSFQLEAANETGAAGDGAGGHLMYNFPLPTTGGNNTAAPAFASFPVAWPPSVPSPVPGFDSPATTVPFDDYSLNQMFDFDYASLGDMPTGDTSSGWTTTPSSEFPAMPQVLSPVPVPGAWSTSTFTNDSSSSTFEASLLGTSFGMNNTCERLQDAGTPLLTALGNAATTAAPTLATAHLRRPATSIGNPSFPDSYFGHVHPPPARPFSSFGAGTNTSTSTSYRMPSTPAPADSYVPWADSFSDYAHDSAAVLATPTSDPASALASMNTSPLPLQGPFSPIPLRGYGAQLYEREQVPAQVHWTRSPGIVFTKTEMGIEAGTQASGTYHHHERPQSQPVPSLHNSTPHFRVPQAQTHVQTPATFLSQPPTRWPSRQAGVRPMSSTNNNTSTAGATGSRYASEPDTKSESSGASSAFHCFYKDIPAQRPIMRDQE